MILLIQCRDVSLMFSVSWTESLMGPAQILFLLIKLNKRYGFCDGQLSLSPLIYSPIIRQIMFLFKTIVATI